MKRVLLVIPPALPSLVANHEATAGMGSLAPEASSYDYPPQLVASCAATLDRTAWQVSVADGSGRALAPFVADTATQGRDMLAVQVGAGTWLADLAYLRILRRGLIESPNSRSTPAVLLFGPSTAQVCDEALGEGVADAVLVGEPELALAAALERVGAGARGRLAAHELASGRYTADDLLADLDAVPFADWSAVPWQPYKMVSLLSSRGCDHGCAYCAYVLTQGRRFRAQSVERTVAEWRHIAREVRPPYLIVRDPVFAYDRERAGQICERIAGEGLTLGWACESRPEHFDRELIRVMKAAGCATIKIGMESGDPTLLARLGRTSNGAAYLEQVGRVARWCEEAGIRCRIFLMAGLPGESAASVQATLTALRRITPHASVHPNVYRAYEGVALMGVNQPVAAETLEALQNANRTASSSSQFLRRAARALGRLRPERRMVQSNESAESAIAAVQTASQKQEILLSQAYPLAHSSVFLTGGNGFVGGHVARALAAAGAHVVALVRPDSPLGALADLPVEIIRGDLTQPSTWTGALNDCAFCFHVAALYAGSATADAMYAVNARATGALLAACVRAGVARFIYTGTVGTVGRPTRQDELPDEETPFKLWDQSSHYVRSKRLGELLALAWNGSGLDVVIVKPTAPVGPGDGEPGRSPSATGRRILQALQGGAVSYPPGGVNHAPVVDIAAGHLLAAERGRAGATYILGHREGNLDQAAFYRLVAQAARANGLPVPRQRVTKSAGGLALTADPTRAVRELGLPQSDLATAFAEAVAWYGAAFPQELLSDAVAA